MDLVAPTGNVNFNGDVRTLDRSGSNGYNNGNYMDTFGGTSAACPQVSGVIALMLSRRPDMTESQIVNLLQQTATDMGNSGFDNTYGYGRVNAYAAIQMAQPLLDEIDQVCYDVSTTINLNNSQNYPVTWQVSTNVNKISSNNQSITIRSLYPTNTGLGWVKATFNGVEHTEAFGVNKAEDEINMSVTVSQSNNYLTVNILGGSGQTPYHVYLNDVFKLTTYNRTVGFSYYQNSGRVEIRNQNSCETGWNYAYYTGYFGGSYYYSYNVFPNPASETLTLEKIDSSLDNLKSSNFNHNKNSRYELYNFYQSLVSKGPISNLTNLDVSNYKKGRYILLIITDGNYESHNLMFN